MRSSSSTTTNSNNNASNHTNTTTNNHDPATPAAAAATKTKTMTQTTPQTNQTKAGHAALHCVSPSDQTIRSSQRDALPSQTYKQTRSTEKATQKTNTATSLSLFTVCDCVHDCQWLWHQKTSKPRQCNHEAQEETAAVKP